MSEIQDIAKEQSNDSVDASLINKLNAVGHMRTFLRTQQGFDVTNHEGFVCVDHLTGGAAKLVDRLEFSRANFSHEIIKGWES